ncbi:Uncharacterised protein r2_g753 [Pycnogonum litorale]
MNTIADFNWPILIILIYNDSVNYRKARQSIINQPYYAYSPDFSVAYSTRFKSLGYAAWKLLQKPGDNSLTQYREFQNVQIVCKPQIDEMINKWELKRTDNPEVNDSIKILVQDFLKTHRMSEELEFPSDQPTHQSHNLFFPFSDHRLHHNATTFHQMQLMKCVMMYEMKVACVLNPSQKLQSGGLL